MDRSTSQQQQVGAHRPPYTPPHPPLALDERHSVETGCAAFHLNRSPQTLRIWACKGIGPLRPAYVNGRLAWALADIRKLLGVSA